MGAFAPTDPELIGIFDLNNRNALLTNEEMAFDCTAHLPEEYLLDGEYNANHYEDALFISLCLLRTARERNEMIEKTMGGYGLQDERLEKEVRMIAQVGDRAHG